MRAFAWRWAVNALGLAVAAALVPGIRIATWAAGLGAALLLGLANATLRPLALLLSWPLQVLTLGLFTWVVNAALILLVAWVVEGFEVAGFFPAVLGALLVALVSTILTTAPGRGR